MDVATPAAPPVVAVTVVHEPGIWFDEVLGALREQDYPNLRLLFLITGETTGVGERIRTVLPEAHVRAVPVNEGYGATAHQVLQLVEGSGLFCFLHDDVALDPDAISRLVEELYRSNAGIVGPKLLDWDRPGVLQSVGCAVDRFGEIDPLVEPGEIDQEQHDAVRDVFCLPAACLLVRADLFRALGGFDPAIEFNGDALDLCWRAHLHGARVVVVPAARGRHRGQLSARRPDLHQRRAAARARIRTVATLTGRWRVPLVVLQLLVVSLVETVAGAFTGRSRDGIASLYALVTALPGLPGIVARRRRIRHLRTVPNSDVVALQLRGSARLTSFWRHHGRRPPSAHRLEPGQGRGADERADRLPGIVAVILLAALVIGSRQLISGGVPRIAQFVDLPVPANAWAAFRSAWRWVSLGSESAAPPAVGGIALAGWAVLGKVALLRTLLVVVPIGLGYLGVWRALSFVPSSRARITGVVVYAALPLPYAAVAAGRWQVIATYGALPWALSLVRQASGLSVLASAGWGDDGIADAVSPVPAAELVRLVVGLGVLGAVVGAFSPTFPIVVLGVAVLVGLGTFVGGGARSAITGVGAAAAGLAVSFVLLEPWSFSLLHRGAWTQVVGLGATGPRRVGLLDLATFRIGPGSLTLLAVLLYVPIAAAPLIAGGWRLTWASRAGALVVGGLLLAVLDDRGLLPVRLPEPGIVLAPVALGLAIAACVTVAGFERDIRGARFGWRQPLGLLVAASLAGGMLPAVVNVAGGRWSAPHLGLADYLAVLPQADGTANPGDYRVLFVGDPRVIPLPSAEVVHGVGFAITGAGAPAIGDQFPAEAGDGEALVAEALRAAAGQTTDRAGRLLAPLAIRYVVVPVDDRSRQGQAAAVEPPLGLLGALARQLDLRLVDSPAQLVVYENTAWLPIAAQLDPVAAAASHDAGAATLAVSDIGRGAPLLVGQRVDAGGSAPVTAGTFQLAVPAESGWSVRLDGRPLPTRSSFGWGLAADLDSAGMLQIEHRDGGRALLLVLEGLLFVLAVGVGSGARLRTRRASPRGGTAGDVPLVGDWPVIELDTHPLEGDEATPGPAHVPVDDGRAASVDAAGEEG